MQTYIIVAIIAYLLGSIPFGYILVRLFRKQDVRTMGSGNIGATNVARSGAKGLGIATLILDAAKGYAAVMLAYWCGSLGFSIPVNTTDSVMRPLAITNSNFLYTLAFVAAIGAIIGHMYPIWLKFKGGKGVATGVGVFLALAPKAVGIVLLIFLAIVWFSRYVSLGSIIATASFPLFAWLLYRNDLPSIVFIAAASGALLIIVRHKDNIRRLIAGTEHRLGEKKSSEVRA
jgi:glycerol-3-phosphate acyltransferase PlsY